MTYIELMGLAHDGGFQRRVLMTMFQVAKDKSAPAPGEPDLSFINAILRGAASPFQMAIGVLLNNTVANAGNTATSATDAQLKTAVEQVWPFYAVAGV